MSPAPLVAIDIGGTNTKLRFVAPDGSGAPRDLEFQADTRAALVAIVRDALAEHAPDGPAWCVVSAAGPVTDDGVTLTNWHADRRVTLDDLVGAGVDPARSLIVNDMVVSALGIVARNEAEGGARAWCQSLYEAPARARGGNMVIIMPGTGLGVAGVVRIEEGAFFRWHVVPCELQHASIGYINEEQKAVSRRMQMRLGLARPSWEDFACGRGLEQVYRSLRDDDDVSLSAPQIAARALTGDAPRAHQALSMFYLACGGIAQLAALSFLPGGGVYLSGRSTKNNVPFIPASPFLSELQNNRTHGDLLRTFDVFLVTADTNLDGGIYLARQRLAGD